MNRIILYLLIATLVYLFSSCTSGEPTCIDDMVEDFKREQAGRSFVGISTFELAGATYYIFDSGVAFDATASVVDEACQTVCIYGGLRANSPLPCDDFQDGINTSQPIWPE